MRAEMVLVANDAMLCSDVQPTILPFPRAYGPTRSSAFAAFSVPPLSTFSTVVREYSTFVRNTSVLYHRILHPSK